jgi:hypothetical protein
VPKSLLNGVPALSRATHVVEEVRPPLHGDALEYGEHCKQDVVKLSDPVVGPFPVGLAFCPIGAGAGGFLCPTRSWRLTLNVIYGRKGEESAAGAGKTNREIRSTEQSVLPGSMAIGRLVILLIKVWLCRSSNYFSFHYCILEPLS